METLSFTPFTLPSKFHHLYAKTFQIMEFSQCMSVDAYSELVCCLLFSILAKQQYTMEEQFQNNYLTKAKFSFFVYCNNLIQYYKPQTWHTSSINSLLPKLFFCFPFAVLKLIFNFFSRFWHSRTKIAITQRIVDLETEFKVYLAQHKILHLALLKKFI